METIKKRLELATEMYQHLPVAQKERFGTRLRRLNLEAAEIEGLPPDERELRTAALVRLVEDLDHDLAEYARPMHLHA